MDSAGGAPRIGRVPVRNLWLLMLYAADIARFGDRLDVDLEGDPDDLPDLIAELLTREVERRMRRGLSRGYRRRSAVLTRVRGRIDALPTYAHRLLDRGEVACRFDELTWDTPRNRLVRAALLRISMRASDEGITARCRASAAGLGRAGVSAVLPSHAELTRDAMGRNDMEDRFMIALARLALDLALPTEDSGETAFVAADREDEWIRRLFEKAVGGFYSVEFEPKGWRVRRGGRLYWQQASPTSGIESILPSMQTDVILYAPDGHRIVIDTKFTSILGRGRYREESLKSEHLYQLYAYLRSQERPEDGSAPENDAAGLLLHPAIDREIDEAVTIQRHRVRFATVDLSQSAAAIRSRLREVVRLDTGSPRVAAQVP